jgi:hypothetical protein
MPYELFFLMWKSEMYCEIDTAVKLGKYPNFDVAPPFRAARAGLKPGATSKLGRFPCPNPRRKAICGLQRVASSARACVFCVPVRLSLPRSRQQTSGARTYLGRTAEECQRQDKREPKSSG